MKLTYIERFVLVQNIWYWFKKFVLVQKFCTGSENLVPRVKIELQHLHSKNQQDFSLSTIALRLDSFK